MIYCRNYSFFLGKFYDEIKMRRRRAPVPGIVIYSLQSKCYDLSDYTIIPFIGRYTFAELIIRGVRAKHNYCHK